jgi:hypothetical protein
LNEALLSSRDGIVGHWPSSADNVTKVPGDPKDDTNLLYLTQTYRGFVLDHILSTRFAVVAPSGTEGEAEVLVTGKPLLRIVRPDPKVFVAQLDCIKTYADLRADRIAEVNIQIDDILSFFGALAQLDSGRRRYTLELLNAVQRLCFHVEFMVKHLCRAARPVDFSPSVQPMIQTPSHSSYPNGHACEAFALATVLWRLRTRKTDVEAAIGGGAMEFRLAERIAANRIIAGVHFPVDTIAGAVLGTLIGQVVLDLADVSQGNKVPQGPVAFDPADNPDFALAAVADLLNGPIERVTDAKDGTDDIFKEFWSLVDAEWK